MQHLINLFGGLWIQNMVLCLMISGFLALCVYIAGTIINKVALSKIAQGQAVTWPYKPLALSLHIAGIVVLVFVSVALGLLGAYEPFFNLF